MQTNKLNAKPLLLPADELQAVVDGKTQFREVIELENKKFNEFILLKDGSVNFIEINKTLGIPVACAKYTPKHKIGDVYYLQEEFKIGAWRRGKEWFENENGAKILLKNYICIDHKINPDDTKLHHIIDDDKFEKLVSESIEDVTKAGISPDDNEWLSWDKFQAPTRHRPASEMPKEYARYFLVVEDVRVEMLQDISNVCIEEEGAPNQTSKEKLMLSREEKKENMDWFIAKWDLKYPDGQKWVDNPYVEVATFRLEKR